MGRRTASIWVFATLLSVSGCGTTHYFVPPMPLEKSESAVFITWHYDLRGLNAPNPVPDFHFYYGLGREWNLGFGASLPIFLSHVSAAKYWAAGEDYRYGFMHFGQVAGVNSNPLIEAGWGYASHGEAEVGQVEAGLAYGNGSGAPLAIRSMDSRYNGGNRLLPLARVQISGRDFGGSVQYYHGLTGAHLRNLEGVVGRSWTGPEKLLRAEEVDSVAFYPSSVSSEGNDHLVVFMKSGWQYDLFATSADHIAMQQGMPAMSGDILVWPMNEWPTLDGQLPKFPPDSLPSMLFRGVRPWESGGTFLLPDEPLIGSVDSIAAMLERGEDVQLRSYTDVQAEILRQWRHTKRWFWNDLSVGAAAVGYSRD